MPLAFDDGHYTSSSRTFSGEPGQPGPSRPTPGRTRHRLLDLINASALYPNAEVILWRHEILVDGDAEDVIRDWAGACGFTVVEWADTLAVQRADGTHIVTLYTRAP